MKKIASMNKNEVLDTINKLSNLQSKLLTKLAQNENNFINAQRYYGYALGAFKEMDRLAKSKSFKDYATNQVNYYINSIYKHKDEYKLEELADSKQDLGYQITRLSRLSAQINSAGGGGSIDPNLAAQLDKIDKNLSLAKRELDSGSQNS
jgi:hypothetical protein